MRYKLHMHGRKWRKGERQVDLYATLSATALGTKKAAYQHSIGKIFLGRWESLQYSMHAFTLSQKAAPTQDR
jgi:hypothetical protein